MKTNNGHLSEEPERFSEFMYLIPSARES